MERQRGGPAKHWYINDTQSDLIIHSSFKAAFLVLGESRDISSVRKQSNKRGQQVHDARHAEPKIGKRRIRKMGKHVVNSVIHACEESNRRHSYIEGKRIRKRISLQEISIKKRYQDRCCSNQSAQPKLAKTLIESR